MGLIFEDTGIKSFARLLSHLDGLRMQRPLIAKTAAPVRSDDADAGIRQEHATCNVQSSDDSAGVDLEIGLRRGGQNRRSEKENGGKHGDKLLIQA